MGSETYKLSRSFAPVWTMCHLGADGLKIASGSFDRTVCIWDVADVRNAYVIRSWRAAENSILCVAAVGEGQLATCAADKEVKFWDWQAGDLLHTTRTRGTPAVLSLVNSQTVAIGGGDATIRIYDWAEGRDLKGKNGFLAMEFCITDMCCLFLGDSDEVIWIPDPILYQTVPRSVGEQDARAALRAVNSCVREAINYQELD